MPYDDNHFTHDIDSQHLERARILEEGIVTHGPSLGFDPEQIASIAGHRLLFEDALSDADKEYADVDEVYAELAELEKQTRVQYMKCHYYVLGEMVFAGTGTIAWLEEAFDAMDELPARRSDLIKVADFAWERYNNIAVEHPDVILDASLFDELRNLLDQLIAKERKIPKERGEAREATAVKNSIRQHGEKIYRWVYRRAISFWGNNDSRLLELGMVPKSLIGTPQGPSEPEEPEEPQPEEFPAWPGPTGKFTLRYWGEGVVEIVYGGVQESTIGWLHRSVPGAEDWIEVNKHLPMNEEDILPFREMHVPIGMWEFRFIPMRGVEKGVASFALIEVV
jgi:hypothetical protein